MIENVLNSIGFVDYVNSKKPDNRHRKTRTEVFNERLITFQIVYNNGKWYVDNIFYDGENKEDVLKSLFNYPYDFEKVISFIEKLQSNQHE